MWNKQKQHMISLREVEIYTTIYAQRELKMMKKMCIPSYKTYQLTVIYKWFKKWTIMQETSS